jgi:hypothetical protein
MAMRDARRLMAQRKMAWTTGQSKGTERNGWFEGKSECANEKKNGRAEAQRRRTIYTRGIEGAETTFLEI